MIVDGKKKIEDRKGGGRTNGGCNADMFLGDRAPETTVPNRHATRHGHLPLSLHVASLGRLDAKSLPSKTWVEAFMDFVGIMNALKTWSSKLTYEQKRVENGEQVHWFGQCREEAMRMIQDRAPGSFASVYA